MLAQTWSEHCVHKTFKALIERSSGAMNVRLLRSIRRLIPINGLLKTYIRAATEKLNKPWVRVGICG